MVVRASFFGLIWLVALTPLPALETPALAFGAPPRAAFIGAQREGWDPGKPVTGTAIHFCSCDAPCKCMFDGKDMKGCNLAGVYHFVDGGYISKFTKASVTGLTIAVLHRPDALLTGPSKDNLKENGVAVATVIYTPAGITKQQEQALKDIYDEHLMGPGFPVGSIQYRRAPITFRAVQGGYEITIPKILHALTKPMVGADNFQLAVDNVDFREGKRWLLGRSSQHTYQDPVEKAWNWSLPNSNGAWTKFSWTQVYRG